MHKFPPNINPELFTVIGCIVGLVVEDDYNANELNSIGNWLILVGQVLLTTAAQQQLINARYSNNEGSNIKSDANNHYRKNQEKANQSDLNNLAKMVEKMSQELNKLKDQ